MPVRAGSSGRCGTILPSPRFLTCCSCLSRARRRWPAPPVRAEPASESPPAEEVGGKKLELRGVAGHDQRIGRPARRARTRNRVDSRRPRQAQRGPARRDGEDRGVGRAARRNRAPARHPDRQRRGDPSLARRPQARGGRGSRRAPAHGPAHAARRCWCGPEDMLQAIRTSMLLGAVLPELRAETEALAGDLRELVRLRNSIAGEKQNLASERATLRSRARTARGAGRRPPEIARRSRDRAGRRTEAGRPTSPARRPVSKI